MKVSQTKTRLGIVGGGQLGRMLTSAALELGLTITVVDPGENPPAKQVGATHIRGSFDDHEAITQLAEASDVITWEIEHISVEALAEVTINKKVVVEPSLDTLAMIKDKYLQKKAMADAGIAVSDFVSLASETDAETFFGKHSETGIILKARTGAYDGRGNYVVRSHGDIAAGFQALATSELYAEKLENLEREVSVIIAKGDDEIKLYDPVDSVNENNICNLVIAPSQAPQAAQQKCVAMAQQVAQALQGRGVFAIEMLVTASGEVLLNEIAPRVHNTGHHSIEGCRTSQFEQHVRCVMGLPLGETDLLADYVVMNNILGSFDGEVTFDGFGEALAIGAMMHAYGKTPNKVARKMGHFTMLSREGESLEEVLQRAAHARKVIAL